MYFITQYYFIYTYINMSSCSLFQLLTLMRGNAA